MKVKSIRCDAGGCGPAVCVCVEGGSAELKYTNLLPSDTNWCRMKTSKNLVSQQSQLGLEVVS